MYICLHPYTLTSTHLKYPLHQHTLHPFLPPIILPHMPTSHIQFTHTFTLHIHTLPSPCTHYTRGEVTMSPSHIPLSTKTPLITSVLQLCLLHCSTFRTGQSLTTISQRIGQSHVLTINQIHHSLCLILCIPMVQVWHCITASPSHCPPFSPPHSTFTDNTSPGGTFGAGFIHFTLRGENSFVNNTGPGLRVCM